MKKRYHKYLPFKSLTFYYLQLNIYKDNQTNINILKLINNYILFNFYCLKHFFFLNFRSNKNEESYTIYFITF